MQTPRLLRLRLRKFVTQYRYLDTELEEIRYVFEGYNAAFKEDFKDDIEAAMRRAGQPEAQHAAGQAPGTQLVPATTGATGTGSEPNASDSRQDRADAKEGPEPKIEPEEDTAEPHPDRASPLLKRLFHKLALKVHPDKTNGATAETFRQLQAAYAAGDVLRLILLAEEHGLLSVADLLTEPEDVRPLETSIYILQQRISHIQSTLAWVWGDASTAEKTALRPKIAQAIRSR